MKQLISLTLVGMMIFTGVMGTILFSSDNAKAVGPLVVDQTTTHSIVLGEDMNFVFEATHSSTDYFIDQYSNGALILYNDGTLLQVMQGYLTPTVLERFTDPYYGNSYPSKVRWEISLSQIQSLGYWTTPGEYEYSIEVDQMECDSSVPSAGYTSLPRTTFIITTSENDLTPQENETIPLDNEPISNSSCFFISSSHYLFFFLIVFTGTKLYNRYRKMESWDK